jgi:hypothetical protein
VYSDSFRTTKKGVEKGKSYNWTYRGCWWSERLYRCRCGRYPVFAGCVTTSNYDSLSSTETGINRGVRRWNKHFSEWARCQKALCGICFTK